MEPESWLSVLFFVLLLFLSAFFSGSESAFFSISELELRSLKEKRNESKIARQILALLNNSKRLLTVILIGNTVVNVTAATVVALLSIRLFPQGWIESGAGVFFQIVIVTLLILVFSEVTPKVFAVKQHLRFAEWAVFPMTLLVKILAPISFVLESLTNGISKLLGVKKDMVFINEEEIKTLIDVSEEKGALDPAEKEMIHSIFEFRETMVREVMVPRMDMVCVEKSTPLQDVLALIKDKGHSRIPMYDEKVDNIMGILFVKDLLPGTANEDKDVNLVSLVRKAYFVPETKMIDELLREFQQERIHMAIVVDEYGGTAGLVTMEDVLEEIVGEIRDEYDKEKPLVRQISENGWIVDAKINLEELNAFTGLTLPTEEDYESLGGLIFSILGRVPQEKEKVPYQNLAFIIEAVQGQRILKVRMIHEKSDSAVADAS